MKNCFVWIIAGLSLIFLPCLAGATLLSITNWGFESPTLGSPGSTGGSINGWNTDYKDPSYGNLGVFYPPASGNWSFPSGVPEGVQVGWLSAAGISQTLSDTLQASTKYTLSLNVGRWENSPTTNYTVVLWAGGTPLGSFSKALSTIPDNTFVEETITYTSPATVAVGQQLKIEITNGYYELDFDNVRLDATPVPVPPSLWLLGSGLIGLVGLRRKFFSK